MALQFVSGSLAACGAVTITNPFDMLKTRRQLHNELGILSKSGNPRTIRLFDVWHKEGLRGLQKGLLPAYIYQVLMNGTRFMVYERIRHFLVAHPYLGWLGGESRTLMSNAGAGAFAGGIAALIGTPFNLIKTRLQSYSPHFTTGVQHGYPNSWSAIRHIGSHEGLRGFYRGVSASILRTSFGSAAQLSCYEWAKRRIAGVLGRSENAATVHFASAMLGGMAACLVMNPFDVVMTRLYNQKHQPNQPPVYGGLVECAGKTVRAEGVRALFKGLVPHFVRIGPHTVLTLVLLEQFRSLLRPVFVDDDARQVSVLNACK